MKIMVWFVLVLSALSAAGEQIQAHLNKKVTIKCGFGTFSRSLVWYHRDQEVFTLNMNHGMPSKVNRMEGRATLKNTDWVINQVIEEDVGDYVCAADGKQQTHTLFVLSVSVSPSCELQVGSEATLQCQIKGLNLNSPVQWKKPREKEPSESATVHLKPVTHSHEGDWVCMSSHNGNTYSEKLNIKVTDIASETKSPSQTSKNNSVKTPPSPPSGVASGLLGLSWWVWVAVGVGSLVVVFLMVLVIILCKRIKRRKKRVLKMKNMKQPLKPRQYCQCDHQTAAAKPKQGRRSEKPSALSLQPLLPETQIEGRREREGVRGREGRK
ncbi:hypothetical protein PAMP_002938 [Pampus punctatissimus]